MWLVARLAVLIGAVADLAGVWAVAELVGLADVNVWRIISWKQLRRRMRTTSPIATDIEEL